KQYGYKKGDFPITESVSDRTIALPFYNDLKDGDIEYVAKHFSKILQGVKKSKIKRKGR
ncbi:MAG: hypothetical protein GY868_17270, partial [Deltaproteobacteria bacterium]|nr:hypothetical protein [Deltaproteobacteria bacterium]